MSFHHYSSHCNFDPMEAMKAIFLNVKTLTTDMSSCTPAKFCSARRQILKEFTETSSIHKLVASCLSWDLWCSAVAKIVGGREYFP